MLNHKLKKREPEERLPPDLDEQYEIIAEYRAGDEKRPIVPLLLKFLRERMLLKHILLLSLLLNIFFVTILFLNVVATLSLASAQSNVAEILANQTSNFVRARVISNIGNVKIIELTFSTKIEILDAFVWVRKAYVAVEAG
jgi:hypothetical protein